MAELQHDKILKNSSSTIFDNFQTLTTSVGSRTQTAEIELQTTEALFIQAEERVQVTGGVNLDEEASNLLRFQQSYQAAARIITTASTIFETLLQSVQ
jgi:flagellar hook-associated protein 1 FlgK